MRRVFKWGRILIVLVLTCINMENYFYYNNHGAHKNFFALVIWSTVIPFCLYGLDDAPSFILLIYSILQERCASADTISLVAQLLHRSKAHLQSMVLQNSAAKVEEFYVHMVRSTTIFIQVHFQLVIVVAEWIFRL